MLWEPPARVSVCEPVAQCRQRGSARCVVQSAVVYMYRPSPHYRCTCACAEPRAAVPVGPYQTEARHARGWRYRDRSLPEHTTKTENGTKPQSGRVSEGCGRSKANAKPRAPYRTHRTQDTGHTLETHSHTSRAPLVARGAVAPPRTPRRTRCGPCCG